MLDIGHGTIPPLKTYRLVQPWDDCLSGSPIRLSSNISYNKLADVLILATRVNLAFGTLLAPTLDPLWPPDMKCSITSMLLRLFESWLDTITS